MKPFVDVTSRCLKLLEADVDTDQMVPARFLRTSVASGLGLHLFYDRCHLPDGTVNGEFPISAERYDGEQILLAGANFGCGSSREHAPWALSDFGFRVVIAPSFADIFYNNCLKNGLLAVTVSSEAQARLVAEDGPVTVSLERLELKCATLACKFPIDPFARYCLLQGIDQFDFITKNKAAIARFEMIHGESFPPLVGLL